MSLREQLLKAGLVSKEKAREVEVEARRQSHRVKKDKEAAAAEAARKAEEKRLAESEEQHKKEHDRQLNLEQSARKKTRELSARINQVIDSNRLNEMDADIRYNFLADDHRIQCVRVTPQQQKLLAAGRIGIVRNIYSSNTSFSLLPRSTVLRLQEICQECIVLLYPEEDLQQSDQFDWPD